MIRRGTTPIHTLTFPFNTGAIKSLMIIYAQGGVELFHKNKEDCSLDGNTVRVTLTQEDTLSFDYKRDLQIQARVITHDGTSLVSKIETVTVGQVLNNEVML